MHFCLRESQILEQHSGIFIFISMRIQTWSLIALSLGRGQGGGGVQQFLNNQIFHANLMTDGCFSE